MKKTLLLLFCIIIPIVNAGWVDYGLGIWYNIDTEQFCNEKNETCPPLEYKYSPATETVCDPLTTTCNMIIHAGTRFGYEDNQWKPLAELRSYKDSTNITCIIETDGGLVVDCIDWNATSLTVELKPTPEEIAKQNLIPVKVYDRTNLIDTKYDTTIDFSKTVDSILKVNFTIADTLHFGDTSTTVILEDNGTELVDDTHIRESDPDTNYGLTQSHRLLTRTSSGDDMYFLVKFDIDQVPDGSTINSATFYAYVTVNNLDTDAEGYNGSAYHLIDQDWDEQDPTWNNIGGYTWNATPDNEYYFFGGAGEPVLEFVYWNMTPSVRQYVPLGYENYSVYIIAEDVFGTPYSNDYVYFAAREYYIAPNLQPYMNITYTEGGEPPGDTCDCDSIQAGTTIDCTEDCTIDGACDASGEDLVFDGAGTVRIESALTNYGDVTIKNSCNVICIGGCF